MGRCGWQVWGWLPQDEGCVGPPLRRYREVLTRTDDRFIVKQLQRSELESFLQFSTSYFDYIGRAFFHGLPTLLAKILGLFRIGYTNKNRSMRMDVLVMGETSF